MPAPAWTARASRRTTATADVNVITSPSNPAVRAARKLARPSARARLGGQFLLEGPEGIREALAAGHLPATVLAALAATTTPQGLVAVVPSMLKALDDLPAAPRLVCVLAEVRDPGNAGTVIRSADAFGADAVATTSGSVDPQSPKAARAAAGSLFHLPVVAGVPWPDLRAALRERRLRLVGADPHAPATVDAAPLDRPIALVLGNEAHGLPDAVRDDLDLVVRVPLTGRAESLNLAAAAAVLLYETARRQRGPANRPPRAGRRAVHPDRPQETAVGR